MSNVSTTLENIIGGLRDANILYLRDVDDFNDQLENLRTRLQGSRLGDKQKPAPERPVRTPSLTPSLSLDDSEDLGKRTPVRKSSDRNPKTPPPKTPPKTSTESPEPRHTSPNQPSRNDEYRIYYTILDRIRERK